MKKFIQALLKKSDDGKITFVASDETLDRMGEVVPIDSWDLANFKKNPVLLINHDYRVENIVGYAKDVRVEDKQLLFEPVFHEITQLAKEVAQMVKEGFLNTVSVGFMPRGPKQDGDKSTNELFEVSFVPVPANPSAERIKSIIEKAVDGEAKKKEVEEWIAKQSESTEVQTIICAKDTFDSAEEAANWCSEHDFKSDKVDETDDSYRFRQFDPETCQTDSFRTIDITEGVKAVICRPKKSAEPEKQKDLDADLKEGRVLSGKNRTLISDAVNVLKQSATMLEELLNANDTNSGKSGDDKSREPKVVYVQTEEELKILSEQPAVIRVLQGINRDSNRLLSKLKK